jgi:dipeptidyl aminopeptidase/acylaminoacyl peptidase
MRLDDAQLQPLVQGAGGQSDGKFSPDGRWVAYTSNDSGRAEIYMTSVDSPRQRWPVSTAGGFQPRWGADSKEIYYVTADSRLMAVSITVGGKDVEVGRPRQLFRTQLIFPADQPFTTRYDVASDGRFLLNIPVRPEPPLTVVVNWLAQLQRQQ